jgi:twitching motility protein PilT
VDLTPIIATAARRGASDVHVAAGRPIVLRVRGELVALAEPPPRAEVVEAMVHGLLTPAEREDLQQRGSVDKALSMAGVRCRVNVLRSAGVPGLAVRLLPSGDVSLSSLNLHPDLRELIEHEHGLVIVSGPTGCGKSSTLAALVQEVNRTRARHVVTLEQPVEFELRPARSFIRQREVGRDTPSFAQGLMDAMREDIDVLAVGEMRERETMRLTLDACETGHLVLTTLHSSTVVEALQRIVSAFPAAEQPSVCAQLADVLIAVVTQQLVWLEPPSLLVPQCEVLRATSAVRAVLRQGQFFKLPLLLETGARAGMWTVPRYREWLDARHDWALPPSAEPPRAAQAEPRPAPRPTGARAPLAGEPIRPRPAAPLAPPASEDVIVIRPEEESLSDILDELDRDEPRPPTGR